jgi:diacylglycerol kinase (ATP)
MMGAPERSTSSSADNGGLAPQSARSGLVASFAYAAAGVLRTLCTQRNMKIHWVSGLAVMLVGMALPWEIASRASVLFCVIMVLAMEVLNTALEAFVDLHVKQYARTAMIAKDAAAAAVLIFAAGAVVVFADTLLHRWDIVEASSTAVWRTVIAGVPLLALVGVTLAVPRRPALLLTLGVPAVGLLAFLAWYSRDEVFSLGALAFVVVATVARWKEPDLLAHVEQETAPPDRDTPRARAS